MNKAILFILALSVSAFTFAAHSQEDERGPRFMVKSIDDHLANSRLYHMKIVEVKTGQVLSVILSDEDVIALAPDVFVVRDDLQFWEI